MAQKIKIIFGIITFVIVIAIAAIAYNILGKQVKSDIDIGLAPDQSSVQGLNTDKQKASDFTMTDWNGNIIKLSDLIAKDKPIVLNFWASWCPPCKNEMPEFEKVYQELGKDIQFIMLDLTDGFRETKEKGSAFITEQGYTFPVFFDVKQEGASVYGIRSIPTTFFMKDGYILAEAQGAIDENTLKKGIDLLK